VDNSVGSRTKAWVLPIAVGILAFIALALAVGALGYYLLLSRVSSEHHNASFRFGERVMDDIYGTMDTGSVDGACRLAVAGAPNKPDNFDLDEAVAGCKHEEHSFDD
jgi:hypothetical protein